MDFDDFDAEDAAIIGGVMGFAEESISAENNVEEFNELAMKDLDVEKMPLNLRMYAKAHPHQFLHILETVIKHSKTRRREINDEYNTMIDMAP